MLNFILHVFTVFALNQATNTGWSAPQLMWLKNKTVLPYYACGYTILFDQSDRVFDGGDQVHIGGWCEKVSGCNDIYPAASGVW